MIITFNMYSTLRLNTMFILISQDCLSNEEHSCPYIVETLHVKEFPEPKCLSAALFAGTHLKLHVQFYLCRDISVSLCIDMTGYTLIYCNAWIFGVHVSF